MAEPNPDDDGSKSYFQKTVVLRDWWLIQCPKEFEGKRFGVAGFEDSVETRAMRVFKSSPIIRALDVFTLLASDGIYITLRGFLNKERVVNNGFTPEISREFIFGFPPCWERFCSSCFVGDSFGTDINTVPSTIDKAFPPILSPCKYSNGNVEDNPAESRDKSSVTETDIAEINDKDGSRARAKKTARRKSLHLSEEEERKLESSYVQNTTNEGDHGSECLSKAKSGDVEKNGCEAINNEDNEWKLDGSELQNRTNDGVHGSEGLIKAKSSDVEKDECEVIDNNVKSPAVGCGIKYTDADNVDKVTSASATGESLTPEQRKGVLGTTASPHSLLKDLDKSSKSENIGISKKSKNATKESLPSEQRKGRVKVTKASRDPLSKDLINSSKPGKKGKSKKSEKTLQSDSNVVEPMNHSRSEVEEAEENFSSEKLTSKNASKESLTSEQRKGRVKVTNTFEDPLSKDFNYSSKPGKKGKSKKSEKTLQSDSNVVESMSYLGTKVKSAENKRKLDASKVRNPTTNDGDHGSEGLDNKHSGTDSVENQKSKNATKEPLTSEQQKGRLEVTKTFRHSLSKDLGNSSKPGKKGKSKKSEKTLQSDWNVVEPMNQSRSQVEEAEENLSWEKLKRKIDFDVEVTPEKEVKKQKTNAASTDSVGQKQSRSGRVLVSSLEFWRNQIPVYDMDRNLIQVKDGSDTKSTPSKGSKRIEFSKAKKLKIK
ncbi:unnamed protein product [Arabidopsis halleri]